MENVEIEIKRINSYPNTLGYPPVVVIMDKDNKIYHFNHNSNEINPSVEVMALAKVGDTLNLKYSNKKCGPLNLWNRNSIHEAEFKNISD